MSGNAIYLATVWALPVIIAITFHEAAHGFVAHLLGDDAAWWLGRVSFNPAKHIDPFGTILLPGILLLLRAPFLFGYAKPVPVNFQKLRSPRRDMVLVAAAGPAMNIFLAALAALAFHLVGYLPVTAARRLADNLKNWQQLSDSICLSVKGFTSARVSAKTPIVVPSRRSGTPRMVR